jgi:Fe-Mn family superoxide dismutase
MRYRLFPFCRPWLLSGLSQRLMESHYENNDGGALNRLNAITDKPESLDFRRTPGYVINGLKREESIALGGHSAQKAINGQLELHERADGREAA